MKNFILTFFTILNIAVFGQIPAYYSNVNLTLTGQALKNELATKITVTHTYQISYAQVWTTLQQTDLDPNNSANVLLIYGWDDTDASVVNDRTRDKNNTGGANGQWNREHTYAQSLATPNLTTATPGPGTDAHHIRASDVQLNGNRGNRLYAAGSGTAANAGADWYPGDEWKGDVARMAMYMYLRYGSQCLPSGEGVGAPVPSDVDMIDLFLQWNAEDTVSAYEKNRNNILQGIQGNRNPFIDNPYLATIIWGGVVAQDKWNMIIGISENELENYFTVYPNPSHEKVFVAFNPQHSTVNEQFYVYSITGQLIDQYSNNDIHKNQLEIPLSQGLYILKFEDNNIVFTKKVIIQ